MKKNYFLGTLLSLLMLVALPVKAQVSSMVDLYGTYTFTADMTVTEAGESLKENFANNCEVKIEKDNSPLAWDAVISGFAGATNGSYNVHSIDTENNRFKLQGWNGSNASFWTGGIWMSNAEGIYPFGWGDMPQLGDLYFSYNPDTKEISVPDFTLVTVNHAEGSATIVASFKNAKLTLVAGETVDILDLSGNWHFKAAEGSNNVMEDSELPTEFDMVITKTTEDNKNYTIDLTYHTYNTVQLKGSFDGAKLTIPLDSTVLDADKGIYLRRPYGNAYSNLEFGVVTKSTLSLGSALGIAQYVAEPAEGEAHYNYLQYFMMGTLKNADVEEFNWVGTYKVVAESVKDLDESDNAELPTEFDMVIEENSGAYYVVNFWGNDVKILNSGGLRVDPSMENTNEATILTNRYLASAGGGYFYKIFDKSGKENPLNIKVNEDGTISLDNFFIKKEFYGSSDPLTNVAYYQNITATKVVTDAIESVQQNIVKANGKTYDLSGRLVKKAAKGIFIQNGKKVIVK